MRKVVVVSDYSKKELEDPVKVVIEREGYLIQRGKTKYANRIELDLAIDEVPEVLKELRFKKMPKLEEVMKRVEVSSDGKRLP